MPLNLDQPFATIFIAVQQTADRSARSWACSIVPAAGRHQSFSDARAVNPNYEHTKAAALADALQAGLHCRSGVQARVYLPSPKDAPMLDAYIATVHRAHQLHLLLNVSPVEFTSPFDRTAKSKIKEVEAAAQRNLCRFLENEEAKRQRQQAIDAAARKLVEQRRQEAERREAARIARQKTISQNEQESAAAQLDFAEAERKRWFEAEVNARANQIAGAR